MNRLRRGINWGKGVPIRSVMSVHESRYGACRQLPEAAKIDLKRSIRQWRMNPEDSAEAYSPAKADGLIAPLANRPPSEWFVDFQSGGQLWSASTKFESQAFVWCASTTR
jgi:hypothetical protein